MVADVSGAKVRGARIAATAIALAKRSWTRTDSNGYFRIEHLPPGDYQVTIEYAGASNTRVAVHVTADTTTPVFQRLQLGQHFNGKGDPSLR